MSNHTIIIRSGNNSAGGDFGAPTCDLCGQPATTAFQNATANGPVGQPRYGCAEHRNAPTFTTFGGGWVESHDLTW